MDRIAPFNTNDPAELATQLRRLEDLVLTLLQQQNSAKRRAWRERTFPPGVTAVDAEAGDFICLNLQTGAVARVNLPAPSRELAGSHVLVKLRATGAVSLRVYSRSGQISGAAYQSMTTSGEWMLFVCSKGDSWEVMGQ